jgi:hypothetical protein
VARLLPIILIVAVLLLDLCRGEDKDNHKIPASCSTCKHLHEPDWRPNHSYASTVHVNKVNPHSVDITVAISQYVAAGKNYKNYTIDNSVCQGDCSRWNWKAGADYSVMVYESPGYTPLCLKTSAGWVENCYHKALPANRNISIDFGKIKKRKLPCCGDEEFDEPEFTVSYSLSVPIGDPLRRAQ